MNTGAITATVWKNDGKSKDGEETEFKTVKIERSYKDKNDEWQSTNTLNVGDVPKAVLVLKKAYEHIILKYMEDSKDGLEVEK